MSAEERALDELLGAYALDAVSDEERRMVDEYLMVSPRARQEVSEHREVATMLAWTGMSAPDGLWERIAASLDSAEPPRPTGALASVIGAGGDDRVAAVESLDGVRRSRAGRRGWRTATSWVAASAAAAVVAVVAVQMIGADDTDDRRTPLQAAVSEARDDRDSVVATLVNADGDAGAEVVIDRDGHGYVIGSDLPPLPADQTYQLWGVIGEQVISLGVLGAHPEIEPFSAGEERVATVVLTIEAAGGVISDGNPEGAYVGELG
ncbi:MAG: anti-sigma factor [Acidimicrobiales bacterium]|nr:anti-sigma factor [Acidimicrobiales bacterium]MCB9394604.1 anti-sigma factor [Acidimicrobiaceae bacterium]